MNIELTGEELTALRMVPQTKEAQDVANRILMRYRSECFKLAATRCPSSVREVRLSKIRDEFRESLRLFLSQFTREPCLCGDREFCEAPEPTPAIVNTPNQIPPATSAGEDPRKPSYPAQE